MNILGKSEWSQEQVTAAIIKNHKDNARNWMPFVSVAEFVRLAYLAAEKEGVRGDILVAQAIVETGWMSMLNGQDNNALRDKPANAPDKPDGSQTPTDDLESGWKYTTAQKKIVDMAKTFVGKGPSHVWATYAQDDWCGYMCGTIFIDAGYKNLIPSGPGLAHSWYYNMPNRARGGITPEPGYAAVFDWDGNGTMNHVELVEKVENGIVTTISGNSAGFSGPVIRKTRRVGSSEFFGYGWPNWPRG